MNNFEKLKKDIGIVFQNPDNQFVGSIVKYDVALDSKSMCIVYDEMDRRRSAKHLKQLRYVNNVYYEPNALSGQ